MVRYDPKSWFGLIFKFHKSDTFQQMFWVLVAFAVYTGVVVFVELKYSEYFSFKSTTAIHSLLGFVIGLLLVFRTNTAYERWWEGRKQWGALVNTNRNFALKLNAILPQENIDDREFFGIMQGNFVFAMKEHLRKGVKWEELNGIGIDNWNKIESASHVPNALVSEIQIRVQKLYASKVITGDQLINLDKEMKELIDVLGACERIRNTPIPYSYSLFLKKFIFAYTITMPLGLVFDFQYWTIPIVTFVLYVFGSLELIAEEIEDPFGEDANDLPTDDLSGKIKMNVIEIFGLNTKKDS